MRVDYNHGWKKNLIVEEHQGDHLDWWMGKTGYARTANFHTRLNQSTTLTFELEKILSFEVSREKDGIPVKHWKKFFNFDEDDW